MTNVNSALVRSQKCIKSKAQSYGFHRALSTMFGHGRGSITHASQVANSDYLDLNDLHEVLWSSTLLATLM